MREKIEQIINIIEFFIFLQMFRYFFLMAIWNFRLLKRMFPEKLKDVNSFVSFFFLPWNYLRIDTVYAFPFFYLFMSEKEFSEDVLPYFRKLRRVILKFLFYCFLFILPFLIFNLILPLFYKLWK